MRKNIIRVPLALLVLVALGMLISYTYWKNSCNAFLENTKATGVYTIEKGDSYNKIYATLFDEYDNIPPKLDKYIRRVLKITSLHYGNYEAADISLMDLLNNISKGRQSLLKVTVPEGYNMYNVASAVEAAGINSRMELMAVFTDRDVVMELTGNPYESIEGFLAPGTYLFEKNYPAKRIAAKMVAEFYKSLPENFEANAKQQGLSFYEALTLASIVQKETYSAYEAPIVASVFYNRIKKRMRLQADPTIIYGIFESYDGRIHRADINNKNNRFNTYQHAGLTPTPIANPSAIALNAVASPAKTDYLYFVARKDGTHVFARTYEEHKKNVQTHQLGR